MAVPTISTITPNLGHTGGWATVVITGTNFQLPTLPPAPDGPYEPLPPTVRVFFGGVEARRVGVISATKLFAITGAKDLAAGVDQLLTTVEVRNVDEDGNTISGETVTAANAFTYARTKLDATKESNLSRLVRQVIKNLKRETIEEVVITQGVDWDDVPDTDDLRKVSIAKLPSIGLMGPSLSNPQAVFVENALDARSTAVDTEALSTRNPMVYDVNFTIIAITNNYLQLLNLTEVVQNFFFRNPFLYLPLSSGSSETARFEVQITQPLEIDAAPNASDVFSATGAFAIQAFPVLTSQGFDADMSLGLERVMPEDEDPIDVELDTASTGEE
jgi:hypothetical protein